MLCTYLQSGPLPVLAPFPFDHVTVQGASLSDNGVFTAVQFIAGARCQVNEHAVTNISSGNGPFNSGNYFIVTLSNLNVGTQNVPLDIQVFDGPDSDTANLLDLIDPTSDPSTNLGTIDTCAEGNICVYHIFCDNYNSNSQWTIQISTQKSIDNDVDDNFGNYQLSFDQFVEPITIIGQTRVSTGTGVPAFNTGNVGPENFIHFYHDLEPTIGEDGASSRMFITADNFSTTGTYTICLNFETMVAITENPNSSTLSPVDPITVSPLPAASVYTLLSSSDDDCENYCYTDNIDNITNSQLVFVMDSCDFASCGFPDDFWIGITSSSGTAASFDISISFRDFSIPTVLNVASNPFIQDNEVVEIGTAPITFITGCDGENGEFACEDYYLMSLENSGINVSSFDNVDPALGPYLLTELYAVRRGDAVMEISQNTLAGTLSSCGPQCDGLACSVSDGGQECYVYIPSCNWNDSDFTTEFVANVYGENSDDTIEYGVKFEFGQWPLTTIVPTDNINNAIILDTIKPLEYHHYTISFQRNVNLFDDSRFEVNMWTNHEQMDVDFFWNYDTPAALTSDCGNFNGRCRTLGADDDDSTSLNECSFMFIPCPITNSYDDDDEYNTTGDFLSELREGSLYFSVRGYDPNLDYYTDFLPQNGHVDYTINWVLSRAQPLYDDIVSHQHLHEGFHSNQFYFDVPQDANYRQARIQINDVSGGRLNFFAQCDTLAGTCPCYGNIDSGSAAMDDDDAASALYISNCDCNSRIYISVISIDNDDDYTDGWYRSVDTTFGVEYTITVFADYFTENVEELYAARSLELFSHRLGNKDDYREHNEDYWDAEFRDYDFYHIDFTNVQVTSEDSLEVYLSITSTWYDEYSGDSYYGSYQPAAQMFLNKNGLAGDDDDFCSEVASCFVSLSNFYYYPYDTSDGYDSFSSCTLVVEPCQFDNSQCFDEDDLSSEFNDDEPHGFNSATDEWYVTVKHIAILDNDGSYWDGVIDYQIAAQVKDQSPILLTDGVTLEGFLTQSAYAHYQYNIPTHSADTFFRAEMWNNFHQSFMDYDFYMNYVPTDGAIVKAGSPDDCYNSLFGCDVCHLDNDNNWCRYQIDPCDFAVMAGTFYFSAHNVHSDVPIDYALQFNIRGQIYNTIELLGGTDYYGLPAGFPVTDYLFDDTSSYYSVTIPALPTGVRGWILTIEIDSIRDDNSNGSLYVKIDDINPDNQCDCRESGCEIGDGLSAITTENFYRRYPCELEEQSIYYIHIDANQFDDDENPVDYIIHAKLDELLEVPIVLSQVDPLVSSTQINLGYFDSFDVLGWDETVESDQYKTFSFTRNDPIGTMINVEIFQDDTLAAQQPFAAFLSIGEPYTPSGDNGDCTDNIGPLPNQCIDFEAECVPADYNASGNHCFMQIPACQNPEGSVEWYITIDGTTVALNSATEIINIRVSVNGIDNTLTVPASNDFISVTSHTLLIDSGSIFDNYGTTYARTSASVSIPAATSLTIDWSGPGQMTADFGGDCPSLCQDNQCTIVACNAINDFIFVEIFNSPNFPTPVSSPQTGTISFSRADGPNGVASSTVSVNSNNVVNIPSIDNDDWVWITLNNPASAIGGSHWEANIYNGDYLSYIDLNLADVFTSNSGVPVNMPGLEDYISSFGPNPRTETGSNGCGASPIGVLPEETCCFDAGSTLIAISGVTVGDAIDGIDIAVDVIDFLESQTTSNNISNGVITGDQVEWISVNVPVNSVVYYFFEVVDDLDGTGNEGADLYLNWNAPAGSDQGVNFDNNSGGDFGSCFNFDNQVPSCSANESGTFCEEYLDSCNGSSCIDSEVAQTLFFAIVPQDNQYYLNNIDYNIQIVVVPNDAFIGTITSSPSQVLSLNTAFPPSNIISDLNNGASNLAPYSHYSIDFNVDFQDLPQFIPLQHTVGSVQIADAFFPRIEIRMNGLTQDGVAPTNDLNFYYSVDDADSICGFNTQQINNNPGNVCDLGGSASDPIYDFEWDCNISICNFACGDTIYLSVHQTSSSLSRWTYQLQVENHFDEVTQQTSLDGDIIDFFTYSPSGTSPSTVTLNEDVVEPAEQVYVTVNPSGLVNSDWYYVEVVVDRSYLSAENPTFDMEIYNRNQCYSTEDIVATVSFNDDLDRDGTETIPCSSKFLFSFDPTSTYSIRFDRTDAGSDGYIIDLTITPVNDQIITATVDSTDSIYEVTKEIIDFEWHIFDIEVSDNGYNYLSVTLDQLCCFENGDNLEVYYSWLEDDTNGYVVDVARPESASSSEYRQSSQSCNVVNDVLNGASTITNDIDDMCTFYGGSYRISVWAPENTQLFSDGLVRSDPLNAALVFVPITYHLTVELLEEPHERIALECQFEQNAGSNYIPRMEIQTQAENRGTELVIWLSLPDGGNADLFIANSAHPFQRNTPSPCDWDDDEYYWDTCNITAGGSCQIVISPCDYEDTIWYIFVDDSAVPSNNRIIVGSYYDRKYIPVFDGVTLASGSYHGILTKELYQFYTVDVDPTDPIALFKATLTNINCGVTNCPMTMNIDTGFQTELAADCSSDNSCSTNGSFGSSCILSRANCYPDTVRDVYYLGINKNADDDEQCKYTLDITTQATVDDIQDGVLVCDSVCDADFFRVVNIDNTLPILNESTITVTINNLGSNDLFLTFKSGSVPGVAHDANPFCESEFSDLGIFTSSALASAGNPHQFTFQCIPDDAYLAVWRDDDSCSLTDDCDGNEYNLLVTINDISVDTITTTSSSASGNLLYVHNGDAVNTWTYIASGSPGVTSFDAIGGLSSPDNFCGFDDCDDDLPSYPNTPNSHNGRILLDHNVANNYYFSGASNLVLDVLTTSQMTTLTATPTGITFFSDDSAGHMEHMVYTPSINADSVTFYLDSFDACSCDLPTDNLSDLELYYRVSTVAPPFDGCFACDGSGNDDDAVLITSDSCENTHSFTVPCTSNTPIYITISSCSNAFICDVDFDMFVREDTITRNTITGDHNTAYTTISKDYDVCGDIESVSSFYVTVTDILSVSLREPHSSGGDLTASVTITEIEAGSDNSASCSESDSCSITENTEGGDSSCRVDTKLTNDDDDDEFNAWSCSEPGTYRIDVTLNDSGNFENLNTGASVELQVVNSWVALSGSASNSIIGDTRHFYRHTSANDEAIVIQLDLLDGPPVKMYVFDGCDKSVYRDTEFQWFASNDDDATDDFFASSALTLGGFGDLSFRESLYCGNGLCTVYIPTPAKRSNSNDYYIIIDSGGNDDDDDVNSNYKSEKETFYTLTATNGASNCAGVPTTGFCADPSFAGVNVFDSYTTNSVWIWADDNEKSDEAECRYNQLLDWCPSPTDQCKRWLKTFSCLESFPQCGTTGYQLGQCQEVCDQIEIECGTWLSNDPRFEWQCWSNRYISTGSDEASSCVDIPIPPPPPSFQDDDLEYDDEDDTYVELTLEIPNLSFDIIYVEDGANLVGAQLDIDQNNNNNNEQIEMNNNSSSSLTYSSFILAIVFLITFFLF